MHVSWRAYNEVKGSNGSLQIKEGFEKASDNKYFDDCMSGCVTSMTSSTST